MKFLSDCAAVAALTWREATRRRAFSAVVIVTVTIICSAALLPYAPGEDLSQWFMLVETWSVRATAVFAVVGSILLASAALPADFEERRIYLLATKPIGKFPIFLGRGAGFTLLLAVFVAAAAAVTVLYLTILSAATGYEPAARPKIAAASLEPEGPHGRSTQDPKRIRTYAGGRLVWTFTDLDLSRIGDELEIHIRPDVIGQGMVGGWIADMHVQVAAGKRVVWSEDAPAWPAREERTFRIPRERIGDAQPVAVALSCTEEGFGAVGTPSDAWILLPSRPFAWNVAKCFTGIFLFAWIVMSVALAASVRISAPVSALAAFAFALMAAGHGMWEEGLRTTRRHLEDIRRDPQQVRHSEVPEWLLRWSGAITPVVLAVLPDGRRMDASEYLLDEIDIPGRVAAGALRHALPFAAAFWLIGALLLVFREFG
jgi:hypothetical protein